MFGISSVLKRPVIVLDLRDGVYMDPASVCGLRCANGSLRHSQPRGSSPETIESLYPMPFEEVIATLSNSPQSASVISFDTNQFVLIKKFW